MAQPATTARPPGFTFARNRREPTHFQWFDTVLADSHFQWYAGVTPSSHCLQWYNSVTPGPHHSSGVWRPLHTSRAWCQVHTVCGGMPVWRHAVNSHLDFSSYRPALWRATWVDFTRKRTVAVETKKLSYRLDKRPLAARVSFHHNATLVGF